jgi:hypothetical protein
MGATDYCKTRIISYVMAKNRIVADFHLKYAKEISLTTKIKAYTQYMLFLGKLLKAYFSNSEKDVKMKESKSMQHTQNYRRIKIPRQSERRGFCCKYNKRNKKLTHE